MHKIAKIGPKEQKKAKILHFLCKKSTPARKKYTTPVVAVVTSMRYGTLYVSQHTKFTERKTILQLLRSRVDVETEVYLQTTGPQDRKTTQKKKIFLLGPCLLLLHAFHSLCGLYIKPVKRGN